MTRLTLEQYRELNNRETKRKAPSHEESDIQISCVQWFDVQYPKLVLYAIPNGGSRTKTRIKGKDVPLESIRMKREGVRKGIADLFLMVASKGYNGLYIEMKTAKGTQSEEQKAFEKECLKYGYKYVICRSLDQFMRTINDYLR